ncbi:DUF4142 domain-containing protein [Bradyrhizobium sp. WSM471]|jgi:putative membrane protein|uniref:DUF4142 domain-containing protein n=1 Tax=Bradyrhizobium sp. WSM471 TaxID=319017 RepID=UPI00024D199E|nr:MULTISPECIES: DUF4142 domain-containing protein [Bradyrhizobium]EHR00277.1 putative outer membrane protein [Bradyrhizobium sp. WSM471]UFW42393.1 DUF4142 domain-containing protein [Bradyrhizobium canariense]
MQTKVRNQISKGVAAVVGLCLMTIGGASAAPQGKASKHDQHFLVEAIQGDLSEVKVGQLAQQKAQSDQAKQFGKMLEQDHSDNLKQAQQLADAQGVQAPSEPNSKQKAIYEKLNGLSGAQFDAAFARSMVKDHEEDVRKFQKEAKSQSPVADFAKQTVPVLQKHLETARSLQKSASR